MEIKFEIIFTFFVGTDTNPTWKTKKSNPDFFSASVMALL